MALWEVPLLTCGRSSRTTGNRVVTGFCEHPTDKQTGNGVLERALPPLP